MSRLIRVTAAAALAAVALAPAAASAAPPNCQVVLVRETVGGPNWTAVIIYPMVECGL